MTLFTRRQQTVNEYLAAGETLNRQGLIWGSVLHEPAPNYTHQAIVTRVVVLLDEHVREQQAGLVCVPPLDVILDETRARIVQPAHSRRGVLQIGPRLPITYPRMWICL